MAWLRKTVRLLLNGSNEYFSVYNADRIGWEFNRWIPCMGVESVTFVESLFLTDDVLYRFLVAWPVYNHISDRLLNLNFYKQADISAGRTPSPRLFYLVSSHS